MLRPLAVTMVTLSLNLAAFHAADAAEVARGAQLAKQWCANCHVIGEQGHGPVQEGPPNFETVAHSKMTDAQLRTFLTHPHGKMPDLSLSRREIDDLIAYIDSLR